MCDKTWSKYHTDKIYNRNIYDQSKCLPFVFRSELHVKVGPIKIRTNPLTTTKADLLAHGIKSFMESLNVKSGPNVIAGLKCEVQNNQKKYKKHRQVIRQL